MSKLSLVTELYRFVWRSKKWWLVPLIVTMALVGFVYVFSQASFVSPFIYALF